MNHLSSSDYSLPQSILTKLFDCTGSPNGANRGFVLMYINEIGQPSITSKVENACVEMALGKLAELFCQTKEEAE